MGWIDMPFRISFWSKTLKWVVTWGYSYSIYTEKEIGVWVLLSLHWWVDMPFQVSVWSKYLNVNCQHYTELAHLMLLDFPTPANEQNILVIDHWWVRLKMMELL